MTNVRKRRKVVRLRRSERLRIQIPIVIILAIALTVTMIPFVLTVINSLKANVEVQKNIFSLPATPVWNNYKVAFGFVGANIWNSVYISFVQSFVLVVISAVMAYIFAEVKFFGSNLLFYIYILVMTIPGELNTPVNYAFVYEAKLINSNWAVWLPGWSGAQVSGIFMLRIFFMAQPKSIKEAAKIDGANNLQLFLNIVVPLTIPIMIYRFLGAFDGAYNSYLWHTLVLQDQAKMTVISLLILKSEFVKNSDMYGFGVLYAMYMVSGIPLIVVSAISLQFFKGTEFASALKM